MEAEGQPAAEPTQSGQGQTHNQSPQPGTEPAPSTNNDETALGQQESNLSVEANGSERNESEDNPAYSQVSDELGTDNNDRTDSQPKQAKRQEPVKRGEVSVQAGDSVKAEVVKYYEETLMPESCQTHSVADNTSQLLTIATEGNQGPSSSSSAPTSKEQVEIQVGMSYIDEPEKIINKAKQQRVLQKYGAFLKFIQNHKIHSQNHTAALASTYDGIEKKKIKHYGWYFSLKEYFTKYADFCKDFYEKCDKVARDEKAEQMNIYLNIGEELKQGFDQLSQFKQQTGDNYKKVYEFISGKILKDLDSVYSRYINQMNQWQGRTNTKSKQCVKAEEEFHRQAAKVLRMLNRAKEGKREEDDYFIEMSRLIALERNFREQLVQWGHSMVELRKKLIDLTQSCAVDLQFVLNSFKTETNTLYGIQKSKNDRIIKSRKDIEEDNTFAKLITLADSDYIRYALQLALQVQVVDITDKHYERFVQALQYEPILGKSSDLLTNLIVKTFDMKDQNEELVNTVSGNLVLFKKDCSEAVHKISVKHIKSATPSPGGAIEVEERVPGIIFNSKKSITLEFKNGDRAEELICFLGQPEAN